MQLIAQEYKSVNAESMIEFLKHLEAYSSASKIHIISDNGRANKNKAIEAYLPTSKIEIHYLPPYSPNLNPIERLWIENERERKIRIISVMINLRILAKQFVNSFLKTFQR